MNSPTTEAHRNSSMDWILELRTIPLFKALGAEALIPVADIASHVSFAEGEVVFEQGADGDRLYVISQGEVEILRDGERLAVLGPGECFGEMALLERAPRSAAARALSGSRLLTIAQGDFNDLLAVYPILARAIAKVLAARLRDACER